MTPLKREQTLFFVTGDSSLAISLFIVTGASLLAIIKAVVGALEPESLEPKSLRTMSFKRFPEKKPWGLGSLMLL